MGCPLIRRLVEIAALTEHSIPGDGGLTQSHAAVVTRYKAGGQHLEAGGTQACLALLAEQPVLEHTADERDRRQAGRGAHATTALEYQ